MTFSSAAGHEVEINVAIWLNHEVNSVLICSWTLTVIPNCLIFKALP